jgi:hypothetical protein
MFAGIGATALVGAAGGDDLVFLAGLILPIAGAVIGYEISHPDSSRDTGDDGYGDEYARRGFQVVPVCGVTARGSLLGGLSGRF